MSTIMDGKLTGKQKKFCEAMIELNHNQTQSYLKAYECSNYETAHKNAMRLMKNPKIIEYINQLEEEALRQAGVTPARIANELAKMAFAEPDPDKGITQSTKQNAIKLLQTQFGLDKKVIEGDIKTTVINVGILDD